MKNYESYILKGIGIESEEKLAEYLGRDPSGLSKLATRLERKSAQSAALSAELDDLRKSGSVLHLYKCPNVRPDPSLLSHKIVEKL